ncbi:hypothetical protein PR003_g30182 [Phytophthora rubi]|uniref:WLGC domain-containing protein n=1 Tax=Phytophthora rubi TaxID=129364 RepID=A0A6A4BC12_9STRA|nr:hypothetical protein PR002_g27193 [Phytophthora rubi]KAE9272509.1 hypothetical protein PR003_g30182 [Phytophthora rubi]
MSDLTFIHFALFIPVANYRLSMAWPISSPLHWLCFFCSKNFQRLTSFTTWERIVLASMPALNGLPDFAPISDLKSFAVSDRGAWCCNGFLGDCDLTDGKCGVHPMWGTPAATCVASDRPATPTTLAAVKTFSATTCGPVLRPGDLVGPPTPELMAPCNGTMWKQCEWPGGVEAMCYSTRFMARQVHIRSR